MTLQECFYENKMTDDSRLLISLHTSQKGKEKYFYYGSYSYFVSHHSDLMETQTLASNVSEMDVLCIKIKKPVKDVENVESQDEALDQTSEQSGNDGYRKENQRRRNRNDNHNDNRNENNRNDNRSENRGENNRNDNRSENGNGERNQNRSNRNRNGHGRGRHNNHHNKPQQ